MDAIDEAFSGGDHIRTIGDMFATRPNNDMIAYRAHVHQGLQDRSRWIWAVTGISAGLLLLSTTEPRLTTMWTGIAFIGVSLGNTALQTLIARRINKKSCRERERIMANPLTIKVGIKEANAIVDSGIKGTLHWFTGEFFDRHYFFEFSEDHERVMYRLAA